jgi:uncharacterized membrane protein
VNVAIKSLLSCVLLMLLFEAMVYAFHLLNLPNNVAVAVGFTLLLMLAVAGFATFRWIWVRRWH